MGNFWENWETPAILGNWQLGNVGNKELAIRGILWQSGNSGNLQGILRQSWESTGNLAMRGILGNAYM